MKQYLLLVVVVFILLLLLPLPAFGILDEDKLSPIGLQTGTPSSLANSSFSGVSDTSGSFEETFKILDVETGEVLEMSERDFIIGTVAAEMYPTYHIEAMKAQAVASYTYYTLKRSQQRSNETVNATLKGADFSDVPSTFPETYTLDGLKKRWGDNFDTYYKKVAEAVDSVLGKKILYQGEPIFAAYHAMSFGVTEDAVNVWGSGYPYLKPVPSPGDKLSPDYESNVSVKPDELVSALKEILPDFTTDGEASGWISEELVRSDSGTVLQINICGTVCSGKDMRKALGLRSSNFTVNYLDGLFRFKVYGYGHAVGMSQYGADYMARQGANWEEILHTYYTDVEIL